MRRKNLFLIRDDLAKQVFNIQTGKNRIGTCFAMPLGKGFVFVTAKHVLGECRRGDKIFFRKADGSNEEHTVTIRLDNNEGYDLAIFCIQGSFELAATTPPALVIGNSFVVGEVRSLGFPHGYAGLGTVLSPYATPLIRSGVLSGQVGHGSNIHYIFDGIVSGGNSGGPLVTINPAAQVMPNSNDSYILCGVVIEFIPEQRDKAVIIDKDTDKINLNHFLHTHSGMSLAVPGEAVNRMLIMIESQNHNMCMNYAT